MSWDLRLSLEIIPELLRGLAVTLSAAFAGLAIALAGGLLLALLRRSSTAWIARPSAIAIELVRGTPLLVQLYFLYFTQPWLGIELSPFSTGALGIGLHYATYLSEVYRAGIDAVPSGQWDAARSLGLGRASTYRRVILPQAIPPMLPAIGNQAIALLKDTPLLSAITVLELLHRAQLIGKESFRFLEPLTLVGILYLATSLLASAAVRAPERRGTAAGSAHASRGAHP